MIERDEIVDVAYYTNDPNIGGTDSATPTKFWREDGTWETPNYFAGVTLLGSVTNVTSTNTEIVSSVDWSAVPDNAILEFSTIATSDNYKIWSSGKFYKSDVANGRWLGNVDDYVSRSAHSSEFGLWRIAN